MSGPLKEISHPGDPGGLGRVNSFSMRFRRCLRGEKKIGHATAFNLRGLLFPVFALLFLMMPGTGQAMWNLSVDGDARYRLAEGEDPDVGIHLMGASARKTFADSRGDRLIFFVLVEAEDNFNDVSAHELYGQYKGPLGAWNVTAGRFGLPWGLLTGFSASRLLYDMPHDTLLGMDVDNGLKVSGVAGDLDYAFSVTQGYGPHQTPRDTGHGLGVARIGWTPGDTEELSMGLSTAWGRSITPHDGEGMGDMAAVHDKDRAVSRALGGVDATFYLGRWLGRIEAGAGRVDHRSLTTGFAALDYALLPRLDLNLAVTAERHGSEYEDAWFVGFTGNPPGFTIRGGYRYAGHNDARHEVILQIYRQFSVSF